jgi:hypothetical protein
VRVVFLVPWRTDDGPRAAAWALCRRRWEALFPDWPIYEGVSPEGPFQRAAAINDAAAQAGSWDVAVIIDADVMLPAGNVAEAVKRAAKSGKVTWAHRRWRELTKEATDRLVGPKGEKYAPGALGGSVEETDFSAVDEGGKSIIDLVVSKTTALSWSCCIAVRRDSWDRIGGFDERFIGWGHEDAAFMSSAAIVGWDRVEGDVLNLWHPRLPGAGRADKVGHDRYTAQALVNGRLGMRYMVALRRDYGLSDRPEPSSSAVIARDIGNLRKQDEEYARQQKPEDRQRFDDWWPSLEELIDEARIHRIGTVTTVMHTGGDPANWPVRRQYLERSLASLSEKVTGPIVQRVVYDCWGDLAIRAEIAAMVEPLGFYVVGPKKPVDFTAGMQAMWTYLRKRSKGDYIFQVEDDFEYDRPVDLASMIAVLRREPTVVQMALLRDACYDDERETGGILGWPEPAFTFREGYFTHRLFWTLNPCLFRKSVTDRPWPAGHHSETIFGKTLLNDKNVSMGFWGDGQAPWIRHIGEVRAGVGY